MVSQNLHDIYQNIHGKKIDIVLDLPNLFDENSRSFLRAIAFFGFGGWHRNFAFFGASGFGKSQNGWLFGALDQFYRDISPCVSALAYRSPAPSGDDGGGGVCESREGPD